MNWSEHNIARAIARQTLARKCVVLVDNCSWTGHECDVLAVTKDLRIIDIEVKISRADFKADAKKEKWFDRIFQGYSERREVFNTAGRLVGVSSTALYDVQPLVHPRKVWKHYYAMPADIWRPELVDFLPSPASGVLLVREQRNSTTPIAVECIRRSTPAKDAYVLKPAEAIDIARLANLRMWESYRQAEADRDALRRVEPSARACA